MHFVHKNLSCILPKIDEVRYVAKITNVFIIEISETKLDETILSSKVEVDGYDLIRLDRSRGGDGVAYYVQSSMTYSYKDNFCSNIEIIFVSFICLSLSQSC